MHLRRHIGKIKELKGDMIKRYGEYYEWDKGVPLPENVRTKIELRFEHRIKRRCDEMQLTMEEEEKWKSEDSHVMESGLSSSGEEEEEHDSDDVSLESEGKNFDGKL